MLWSFWVRSQQRGHGENVVMIDFVEKILVESEKVKVFKNGATLDRGVPKAARLC